MTKNKVSATITAENQFTDWLELTKGKGVSIFIKGTFTANIYLQYSKDNGITFTKAKDTITTEDFMWTTNNAPHTIYIRVGVPTGNFTSGSIFAELEKD